MNKKQPRREPTVRVIIDTRDMAKDRRLPKAIGKKLYDEGIIYWDIDNREYGCDTDLPEFPLYNDFNTSQSGPELTEKKKEEKRNAE